MSACAKTITDPAEDAGAAPITLPTVRDIVLVASGKGGVGKSTVTSNLACALAAMGRKVGVLDADVTGPSIALMLGANAAPEINEFGQVIPVETHGIVSVSVAETVPAEAGLTWKGPLIAQAIEQLFVAVAWPELDILLVDLPPGTGDVQLTILERVDVSGAVIVTTPQKMATVDAERGIDMFHGRDIPVFGLVENMAGYVCPCCNSLERPFGPSKSVALARRRHVQHLGELPIALDAQTFCDTGRPLFISAPDDLAAKAFAGLATVLDKAVAVERKVREQESSMSETDRAAHDAFWKGLTDD